MPIPTISARLREAFARGNHAPSDLAGTMRVVQAADQSSVDVLIYGYIGSSWWDDESVTAKSVVDALKDSVAKTINVRINSYGGSVSDGLAIHNELRRHTARGATVNVTIDGVAASMASLIAMAGDTITMARNTLMMLHAPWGTLYIESNAKGIRELAEEAASLLDVMGKAMAQSYSRKTGKAADEYEAMWATGKDYWYTADEAKDAGLADSVTDADDQAPDDDGEEEGSAAALAAELLARAPEALRGNLRAALRLNPDPNSRASARATLPAPAGTTTGVETMSKETNQGAAGTGNAADVQAAMVALRTRNTEILALAATCADNKEVQEYVQRVVAEADVQVTAGDVGKEILKIQAKNRVPLNGGVSVSAGVDEREKVREAMGNAIQARASMAKADPANPYRGFTLQEIARACAERAGVNVRGMDRLSMIGAAFTHHSSDFPLLLANVSQKALLAGYNDTPELFPQFTRAVNVSDFKAATLAGLGLFSNLDIVRENGEYKYGTFSEAGTTIQLATYGKLFSISRQAIINDDLNAFTDVPRKMGAAAKRTVGAAVINLLTSNPTLSDSVTLFHATHNNLLTGAAISTTSVDAMAASMAKQTGPGGVGTVMVPLKYLVVPIALRGLALTVKQSQFEVTSNKNNTTPNIVRDTFEVIGDPRLDAASAAVWYGVADPSQCDGIVVAYLDGQQEPYLEAKDGWNVDGTEFKVRIDAAAGIGDHRGLAKNPGP